MLVFAVDPPPGLRDTVSAAATFHDLGKLDPDNQAALASGHTARLPWDHIDAGVAHLRSQREIRAAWLVRAHHAPGLPSVASQFESDDCLKLRGRRGVNRTLGEQRAQIDRTDRLLEDYLSDHRAALGDTPVTKRRTSHGLIMRLALSCLVDADHSDTAAVDWGPVNLTPAETRWTERLDSLTRYVESLDHAKSESEAERNGRRRSFFSACLDSPIRDRIVSCDALVGSGKTTAVLAYMLKRAIEDGLRRIIIVAPFTNILTQTAQRLRTALVLPGEDPDAVIVEHHHRADFDSRDSRELAVTWSAPIVLTTAVSFFESLSGCSASTLRKLHNVPGSAIVIDEAHAALPIHLWMQNWRWMRELTERWSCRAIFMSGSLVKFWKNQAIVGDAPTDLPDILPRHLAEVSKVAERRRITYAQLTGSVLEVDELIGHVQLAPGPRLVILNTVQSAAVVARAMRKAGMTVEHLSTALTPADREPILDRVIGRLRSAETDWVLVATSCVEAGVDFSFRTAFRQTFSTASTIQLGGRVNRNGEYNDVGGSSVYDFDVQGDLITPNPSATTSSQILRRLLNHDALNGRDPAEIVTDAIRDEVRITGNRDARQLCTAEEHSDYPSVAAQGRVIDADTRIVVVDENLIHLLEMNRPVPFRSLLSRSVQLWATKISKLGLEALPGHKELYRWPMDYDPAFLGIMAGVLGNAEFAIAGGYIVD